MTSNFKLFQVYTPTKLSLWWKISVTCLFKRPHSSPYELWCNQFIGVLLARLLILSSVSKCDWQKWLHY